MAEYDYGATRILGRALGSDKINRLVDAFKQPVRLRRLPSYAECLYTADTFAGTIRVQTPDEGTRTSPQALQMIMGRTLLKINTENPNELDDLTLWSDDLVERRRIPLKYLKQLSPCRRDRSHQSLLCNLADQFLELLDLMSRLIICLNECTALSAHIGPERLVSSKEYHAFG